MKLLVLTQKVDKNDDLLGFFHNWLIKLASRFDFITVIALGVGEYDLPQNIKVLSLGKEKSQNKLNYIKNFYKYIFENKANYDAILVHMNAEYVVLGGIWWRLWGKKVALWCNHAYGSMAGKIAAGWADKIFYTSPFAFMARYKKAIKMPVGIDTDLFNSSKQVPPLTRGGQEGFFKILSLGRISPVKKIDVLIKAIKQINNSKIILNIYGDAPARDQDYYKKIKELASTDSRIHFYPKIANYKTADVYNQHDLFVNLTDSGSFDKTILEAMACETLVLVCNQSLKNILPDQFLFTENNIDNLSQKIENIINIDKKDFGRQFRNYVLEQHSLDALVNKFYSELS